MVLINSMQSGLDSWRVRSEPKMEQPSQASKPTHKWVQDLFKQILPRTSVLWSNSPAGAKRSISVSISYTASKFFYSLKIYSNLSNLKEKTRHAVLVSFVHIIKYLLSLTYGGKGFNWFTVLESLVQDWVDSLLWFWGCNQYCRVFTSSART